MKNTETWQKIFAENHDSRTFLQFFPRAVYFETTENKKSGYQLLQSVLNEHMKALFAKLTDSAAILENQTEIAEYLEALSSAAPLIDEEVYDHYRNARDSFCRLLDLIFPCLDAMSEEAAGSIRKSIVCAASEGMISDERYKTDGYVHEAPAKTPAEAETVSECTAEPYAPVKPEAHGAGDAVSSGDIAFHIIFSTARCLTLELIDQGIVETEAVDIALNGIPVMTTTRTVQSLYGLLPDTDYAITVSRGETKGILHFHTEKEFVTLNVRDFGARGDGIRDDTPAIQTAILACPEHSRVLIPEGIYKIGPLFLKSHVTIELEKGAVLSACTEREKFGLLPGMITSYDGKDEYNLATWEGNPLSSFASIITGLHIEDAVICGEGEINGNASFENWWVNDGRIKTGGGFRPRMVFLNACKNVTLQGVTLRNSPSWNIHPYYSDNISIIDVGVFNPKVSPNTDGMDPEAVNGLLVVGVHFSLGDDCIAVKSGKMYMGRKTRRPSENIEIRQSLMQHGHGSVTLGSEIGAGVRNLYCHDCIFEDTDRGLRVKTRRGRGKDSIIDGIRFENIKMKGVLTPFTVNSYYWCCDPDGHSEYVSCKTPLPVDDRTPKIRSLVFRNIEAVDAHVAAGFIYGLPESPIDSIIMENVSVSFAENCTPEYPAMMAEVEPCTRMGMFIRNCTDLSLNNVHVSGQEGPELDT